MKTVLFLVTIGTIVLVMISVCQGILSKTETIKDLLDSLNEAVSQSNVSGPSQLLVKSIDQNATSINKKVAHLIALTLYFGAVLSLLAVVAPNLSTPKNPALT